MKVVILAGGFGSRISEESHLKPKPMIEIGDKPILWHIMKHYSAYGFNDFIICLGYKQYIVKEYFAHYYLHNCDVQFDLSDNTETIMDNRVEPWKVTLVDTGLNTMTGGRIARVKKYIGNEPFMLTYGDGVSDVDLKKLLEFHKSHGRIATITSVKYAQTKGTIEVKDNKVTAFREKQEQDGDLINGGFMVMNPEIFDYLDSDNCVFEERPMIELAKNNQLMTFFHDGFWQCMDTQREKNILEELWQNGKAPWKIW